MPHAQSATFGIWAAVGGRHEPQRLGGISHFIEHMLFKGTSRRTARRIGQEVEEVGGYLNATTTHDHTVYYGAAPADEFNRLTGVLCDLYVDPKFAPRDIVRERAVIAEEIQMYHDEPSELVQELLWEDLWPNHGLGRPLTGTLKSISRIDRDDFLDYRKRHYRTGNTVVSAAGGIQHGDVCRRVESLLTSLPEGGRSTFPPAPPLPKRKRIHVIERDTQQLHVAFAVPCCDLLDDARYATMLLNILLAGNVSSRLFQELREKRGLCYNISSNVSQYVDAGVLNFYVGLDPRNLENALQLIKREFERLRTDLVPSTELRRAKQYAIGSSRMSLERTSSQSSRIGYSVLFYNRIIDAEEAHERIRRVSAEDLRKVASRALRANQITMRVIGPVPKSLPIARWLEA